MVTASSVKTGLTGAHLRAFSVLGIALVGSVSAGLWLVPQFGIAPVIILIGCAAAFLTLIRPFFGFGVLVFSMPIMSVLLLGEGSEAVTFTRLLGIFVFGAWLINKLINRESWQHILTARLLVPTLLYGLLVVSSLLWVQDVDLAYVQVFTVVQLIALSLLTISIVRSWKNLELVITLLILGGIAASILTISESISTGVSRAGSGVGGDQNTTANILVVLLPLAFYLLKREPKNRFWQLIALVFIGVSPLAVALTLSRTSFLLLPPLLAIQLWIFSRGGRSSLVQYLFVGLAAGIVIFLTVPWERVFERAQTLSPLVEEGFEAKDPSGRVQIWLAGVEMFNDNPLLGVGYGGFRQLYVDYKFRVPSRYVTGLGTGTGPRNPHSTFIGILANLGLIGITAWVLIHFVAFRNLKRSWSAKNLGKRVGNVILAQSMFLALAVYVLYSVVATTHDHKLYWILLGLTEVLRRLTMKRDDQIAAERISG